MQRHECWASSYPCSLDFGNPCRDDDLEGRAFKLAEEAPPCWPGSGHPVPMDGELRAIRAAWISAFPAEMTR